MAVRRLYEPLCIAFGTTVSSPTVPTYQLYDLPHKLGGSNVYYYGVLRSSSNRRSALAEATARATSPILSCPPLPSPRKASLRPVGLSPGRGRGAGEQQILQRQDLQASTSVPRQFPQAQHRREQTQRSASFVCASSFTEYRPCAQACVIHFCSHPPTRLLQQRRRSAAARRFFAAAAFGGGCGAGGG